MMNVAKPPHVSESPHTHGTQTVFGLICLMFIILLTKIAG
jgi:hypothetical protein